MSADGARHGRPGLLGQLADEQLAAARQAPAGRAALTVHGGRGQALRQTVLALLAGQSTGEHESPGEATLQVLVGRVRLVSGSESWELGAGDLVSIPDARHDLAAVKDSAVLLTVVPRGFAATD